MKNAQQEEMKYFGMDLEFLLRKNRSGEPFYKLFTKMWPGPKKAKKKLIRIEQTLTKDTITGMYIYSHKNYTNEQNILLEMRHAARFHFGNGTWTNGVNSIKQQFYKSCGYYFRNFFI